MFTEFIQRLDQIQGLNAQDKQLLKETLGSCISALTHRGPVDINVDGQQFGVPNRNINNECTNPAGTWAALKVHNGSSELSGSEVKNGFVIDSCGVANFRHDKGEISSVHQGIDVLENFIIGGNTIWNTTNGWINEFLPGDGKVKVSSGDSPDYLMNQFENFVEEASLPADFEAIKFNADPTDADPKIFAYWDYVAVTNYSDGVGQYLYHDAGGGLRWKTPGACA